MGIAAKVSQLCFIPTLQPAPITVRPDCLLNSECTSDITIYSPYLGPRVIHELPPFLAPLCHNESRIPDGSTTLASPKSLQALCCGSHCHHGVESLL